MTTQDFYENNYNWDSSSLDASGSYSLGYIEKILSNANSIIDVGAWKWIFLSFLQSFANTHAIHIENYSAIELTKQGNEILLKKWFQSYCIDISDKNVNTSELWKFDIVTCFHVLEHVMNTDQFMKNLISLLEDDGILVLEVPNLWYWLARALLLFGYTPFQAVENHDKKIYFWTPSFFKKRLERYQPAGHIHGYTLKWLKDLVKFYWLSIIKVESNSPFFLPNAFGKSVRIYCKK